MKIDSRFTSTPIEVFVLLVTCGVGVTLSGCGVDLKVLDTDVKDDLAWGVYHRMDGLLREGLSHSEGDPVTTNTIHLLLGPEADDFRDVFKPLFSGLLWLAEGSRVSSMAVVFVQGFRDEVQIPLFECLTPFVDEFDLWGIGVFWVGHWDKSD